jgi:hypothetical protein
MEPNEEECCFGACSNAFRGSRAFSSLLAAAIVASLGRLQKLDLYGNEIGDLGAAANAEAILANPRLQQLFLSSNNIGNWGAAAIAASLQRNSTLLRLCVSQNKSGSLGATAIAAILLLNSNLQILDLYGNIIGYPGACGLIEGQLESAGSTTHSERYWSFGSCCHCGSTLGKFESSEA